MTDNTSFASERVFREKLHDLLARPKSEREMLEGFVHMALYYALTTGRIETILEWFNLQIRTELLSAQGQTLANCRFLRGYLRGYAANLSRRKVSQGDQA